MKYYYLVNNLNTTVFDSQFLGWIKEYEKEGFYFDIVFVPTGVKSYMRNFRSLSQKSKVVSKQLKGKVIHSLPSSADTFLGFISLFFILFKFTAPKLKSENGQFPLLYVMKMSLLRAMGGSKKHQNTLT